MCIEIKKRNYKILKKNKEELDISEMFHYFNNQHFSLDDVQNFYEIDDERSCEHLVLVCISLLAYFVIAFYVINNNVRY